MTKNLGLLFWKKTRCKKILIESSKKLRNKINKQQEYFTKDIETLRKNQINLEMNNSPKKMNNKIASLWNKADQIEELVMLKNEI